jgi:hypothetical protein
LFNLVYLKRNKRIGKVAASTFGSPSFSSGTISIGEGDVTFVGDEQINA